MVVCAYMCFHGLSRQVKGVHIKRPFHISSESWRRCMKVYQGVSRCHRMRVFCSLSTYRPPIDIAKKSGPSNLGFKVSQVRGMPTVFPLSSLAIEGLFSVRSMSVARLRQTHVVDLRRVQDFMVAFFGSNSVCMGQCLVWESTRTYWWKQQARPPLLFWGPAGLKWSASSRSNASCPGAWRADLKSSSVRFHFACWTSGRQWQRWPPTESATSMSSVSDVVSYQHIWYFTLFHDIFHVIHGSLNVPIEHHPTIRYMVYNGYYKVMSNIPKMGQLPTPVIPCYFMLFHVMSCYFMLFHVMAWYVMICHVISWYVSCYFMLFHVIPCYDMLFHVMSWYFMLCFLLFHVISCCVMTIHDMFHVISSFFHVISCCFILV